MADHIALQVDNLVKRYRTVTALDGLSLTIHAGELLGLIGPNGAGKSTTVKIVTGQLLADSGTVKVGGHDVLKAPLEARRQTGYVPQDVELYPFLTGRELLDYVAEVRGTDPKTANVGELLERFGLSAAANRLTREYSEGMARKLAVAAALIGDPRLLILDESLTGLDPRAAAEVKAVVRERLEQGSAVLIISHILDVLERLCTSVVLIDNGKLVERLARPEIDAMVAGGTTLEDFFLEKTAP